MSKYIQKSNVFYPYSSWISHIVMSMESQKLKTKPIPHEKSLKKYQLNIFSINKIYENKTVFRKKKPLYRLLAFYFKISPPRSK